MFISKDIKYVGVNDNKIDLFEGQYKVKNGMSYNSYVIMDEKIAVLDTVDASAKQEWLDNIKRELNGKQPDYLVIHHMEPDHSANIAVFMDIYKTAKIVCSQKGFVMIKNFFGDDFASRRIVAVEGDSLPLGKHELTFIAAPMVHWPEVMVSYEKTEKILFSADAFGKFGNLERNEPWDDEARRYYIGIVGKYGIPVQTLLKKTAALDIQTICPLHGPVLNENLSHYIELYNIWSSYQAEENGVTIAYTSVYGHTKKAVEIMEKELKLNNCDKVEVFDLARSDMSEAVANAFRFKKIILATTTYNADVFPFMREFLAELCERNFQNRKVGFIENGSWAPLAAKIMQTRLSTLKNITFAQNTVSILSGVSDENVNQIQKLAKEICAD